MTGAAPWSEPIDFAEEFDSTVVSGMFSDDSRLIGFDGRAGTCGFALAGTGGEVDSTCGACRTPREGRSGTTGCDFSVDSGSFDFAGRAGIAGIWGFIGDVISVADLSFVGLIISFSSD